MTMPSVQREAVGVQTESLRVRRMKAGRGLVRRLLGICLKILAAEALDEEEL